MDKLEHAVGGYAIIIKFGRPCLTHVKHFSLCHINSSVQIVSPAIVIRHEFDGRVNEFQVFIGTHLSSYFLFLLVIGFRFAPFSTGKDFWKHGRRVSNDDGFWLCG